MIAFIIWTAVALVFLTIGAYTRTQKTAAGFYNNVKPPEVKDPIAYNHALGKIWFVAAMILEALGVPFLFFEQNNPVFMLPVLGTVALVVGMIVAQIRAEGKFK